jgi:uncharacterized protein YktB (UPF0637 family)
MDFNGFSPIDFDVFNIDGLDERMSALIEQVRPKLHIIGETMAPKLSELTEEEMFPHVAKHARRSVNPPDDTWVAWSSNKRGYKQHPHFQVGMWGTHLFAMFAIIYESPIKGEFAETALSEVGSIKHFIPADFVWSDNHMKPGVTPNKDLSIDELSSFFERLRKVKKAEILCGIHIDREDPILTNGDALLKKIEHTFETVAPLYKLAQRSLK